MPLKPKVIVFDVNETLLDLEKMRDSVGEALNGQEALLPLWFSTMLHYSLVSTVSGEYQDFGKIGVAALMVAAHGWDVAGAKAAGMQTAFVARPGKALYPLAQKPDYIVKDLGELVNALTK